MCYFCGKRVYLVERHSAEGVFFHRGCLKCDYCGGNLRIGQYSFKRTDDGEGNCLIIMSFHIAYSCQISIYVQIFRIFHEVITSLETC